MLPNLGFNLANDQEKRFKDIVEGSVDGVMSLYATAEQTATLKRFSREEKNWDHCFGSSSVRIRRGRKKGFRNSTSS